MGFLPNEKEMEDSAISTLTESRVLGDLSTTGCLGDTEGMDTTQEHADPEAMDTTQEQVAPEPKTQRVNNKKKRRMDGTSEDINEDQEKAGEVTQKPSKGNSREGIKTLRPEEGSKAEARVLHHDPKEGSGLTPQVDENVDKLKKLHQKQLEDQQKKYDDSIDTLRRELEEKNKREMDTGKTG